MNNNKMISMFQTKNKNKIYATKKIVMVTIFTTALLIILPLMLYQNKAIGQIMTINNITGGTKNATGTITIKDSKLSESNQTHWWQYNAGSRFAP